MTAARVIVVGAGTTGLSAAYALAVRGFGVDLVSLAAPRRSVVASSADSIAAAKPDEADDDMADHLVDAAIAADAGSAASVRALLRGAPDLVERLDVLGVPFVRDDAGAPARLRGSGHRRSRMTTAGPGTKREIVDALDRELARHERAHPGRVRRLVGWEVTALALDEAGACVGVVAQDLQSMEIHAIGARAVLLASGGFGGAWASGSTSLDALGTATAAAVRVGARVGDADALEMAPAALVGFSKRHAISDALRAAGARLWIPADAADVRRGRDIPSKERRDLLADLDREAGHLVAPGRAAQAVARALYGEGGGVFDVDRGELEHVAYFDITHLGGAFLPEARAEIERVWKLTGVDLASVPARVAPSAHGTLGGLAVGFEVGPDGELALESALHHRTSIPGLYAAGSAARAYHGAHRAPGHRLLASLRGGEIAAAAIAVHCDGAASSSTSRAALEATEAAERKGYAELLGRDGDDSARALRASLGAALDAIAGLTREPTSLAEIATEIDDLAARARAATAPGDTATRANRGAPALRRLEATALLARLVVATAQRRHEAEGRDQGAATAYLATLHDGASDVAFDHVGAAT